MTDKSLADMKVKLGEYGTSGGLAVSLEAFMKFDQEINRGLQLLEARWEDLAAPAARQSNKAIR